MQKVRNTLKISRNRVFFLTNRYIKVYIYGESYSNRKYRFAVSAGISAVRMLILALKAAVRPGELRPPYARNDGAEKVG